MMQTNDPTGQIPSVPPEPFPAPTESGVTYSQLPITPHAPHAPPGSAWGVFGEHDEVGTVNQLTEQRVHTAASLVHQGRVFSLNWSLQRPTPAMLGRATPRHRFIPLDGGGYDDIYEHFYPQASSQWDALCHVEHPHFGYYNAHHPDPTHGGSHLGVDAWARRGIAGRWVLVDLERELATQGRPIDCSSRQVVTVEDIESALTTQGSQLAPGTILLLRFGWITWYESLNSEERNKLGSGSLFEVPGLAAEEQTAAWLWDQQVAAVAADCPALEAMPFNKNSAEGFLHARPIPLLGMAIGKLFYLDELAGDCANNSVYQGLFVSAPLNMPGGAGSPANALALKLSSAIVGTLDAFASYVENPPLPCGVARKGNNESNRLVRTRAMVT